MAACGAAGGLALTPGVAFAQTWRGGDGNWNDGSKWSTGAAPNSTTADVVIDGNPATPSTVTLANPPAIASVRTLTVDADDRLNLSALLQIYGNATVNGTVMGGNYHFPGSAPATLGGTGRIVLSGFNSLQSNARPLTIGPGLRVEGEGRITATREIVNRGIISANAPGKALTVDTYPLTNQGTLEAVNGGTLSIGSAFDSSRWTNTGTLRVDGTSTLRLGGTYSRAALGTLSRAPGGRLELAGSFDNSGAVLDLGTTFLGSATLAGSTMNNATIRGGTITASDGAQLVVSHGWLDGVTLATNPVFTRSGGTGELRVTGGLTLQDVTVDLPGPGDVSSLGALVFNTADAQTVGGTGTIVLGNSRAGTSITTPQNGSVTFGPGITLRGWGTLEGPVTNRGSIVADVRALTMGGSLLELNANHLTNEGTVRVADNAAMVIGGAWRNSGTIAVGENSRLRLDGVYTPAHLGTIVRQPSSLLTAGGSLDLGGGVFDLGTTTGTLVARRLTVQNGTLATTAGSELRLDLSDTLGVTLDAVKLATTPVFLGSYSRLTVRNGLTLQDGGSLDLTRGGQSRINVVFEGNTPQTLGGTGTVVLGDTQYNDLRAVNTSPLTIGAGILVRGRGNLAGPITNEGTIRADSAGGHILAHALTNNGVIEVLNGAALEGTVLNQGTVRVEPGGVLDLPGSGSGSFVQNAGRLVVNGAAVVGNRPFSINAGTLAGAGRIEAGGTVTVGGAPWPAAGVPPEVVLSPGRTPDGLGDTGTLTVAGGLRVGAATKTRVEVGGAAGGPRTASDRVAVAGSAALAGLLEVIKAPGYAPAPGDSFEIFSYGSRSGRFTSITGVDAGNGLSFAAVYEPAALRLVTAMPGDANLDRQVNGSDFALLAGNFGRTDRDWTAGDFSGDGLVNGTDFALLAGNFGRSVLGPSGVTARDWSALESFGASAGVTVPEPAAAGMAAATAGLLLAARRRPRPARAERRA